MLVLIRIAALNLLRKPIQSTVVGGVIALVTFIMVLFLSLASGIENTLKESATTLISGHINLSGFNKPSRGSASPAITNVQKLKKITAEIIPESISIIDRIRTYGKVIADGTVLQVPIWGVNLNFEKTLAQQLTTHQGDFSDLSKRGGIALFASQAEKLKVKVGDSITLAIPTPRTLTGTKDLRVVAILKDLGLISNFSVLVHIDDIRDIYQINSDTSGQIMIYLPKHLDIAAIENQLREGLKKRGLSLLPKDSSPFWIKMDRITKEPWIGERLDVTTWKDESSMLYEMVNFVEVLTVMVTCILLTMTTLGIFNVFWMAIKERTKEIGTLRAIGMQNHQVGLLFFLESMILALTSTAAGVILGSVAAFIIDSMQIKVHSELLYTFLLGDTLHFSLNLNAIIFSAATISIFIACGSAIIAFKASKLKPIKAINNIFG